MDKTAKNAFLIAALWCNNHDTISLEDLPSQVHDLADNYVNHVLILCRKQGIDISESQMSQFGHDLWLTNEGHGAGFWDGGWDGFGEGDWGEKLTKIAKEIPNTLECSYRYEDEPAIPVEDIFNQNFSIVNGKLEYVFYQKTHK